MKYVRQILLGKWFKKKVISYLKLEYDTHG